MGWLSLTGSQMKLDQWLCQLSLLSSQWRSKNIAQDITKYTWILSGIPHHSVSFTPLPFAQVCDLVLFIDYWLYLFIYFTIELFYILLYFLNLNESCEGKAELLAAITPVFKSHDPSEISLIYWSAAQETFLLLSQLNIVVLLRILWKLWYIWT